MLAKYLLFAVFATLANLLFQELSLYVYSGPRALAVSMFTGTIVGFAAKYLLDKFFVFDDGGVTSAQKELKKIGLYGLFSVFTTVIFWSSELLFLWLWQTDLAKYIGATLGLAVGYLSKFLLDRRYVFQRGAAA